MATCKEKLIAFIDSTAGSANAEQVVATDADGLIDPSFLTERVQDIVSDNLVTDTTSIVWTYDDGAGTLEADVQDEYVQDVVGAMLTDSSTIDFTYDDGAGTITGVVKTDSIDDTHIDWGTGTNQVNTDDMPEGSTNLYFTDERAQDAVGGILVDSSEIDFTYSDATPSITASIVAGSIDETKLDTSVNASLDLADSALQITDAPGSNAQVIYNNSGSFSASSDFVWDYSNDILKLTKTSSGGQIWLSGDGVQIFSGGDDVNHTYNGSTYAVTTSAGSGFTFNGATVWRSDNDGAGSGLDSDLLDGQEGSYYLARANHTGTQTLSTISDAGTAAGEDTGTSGANVPLMSGTNTWSGQQTFNNALIVQTVSSGDVRFRMNTDDYDSAGGGQSEWEFVVRVDGDFAFNYTLTPGGEFIFRKDGSLELLGTLKTKTYTVAGLPTGSAGMRAFVTDANSTTFASAVTGGGANGVPVYYDGSTWRIG